MQAIGGIAELKNSVLEKDQEKDEKEEEQDKEQELQNINILIWKKPSDAELIQATGGWVQAVGSVISLIGQLRSNEEENSGEGSSNESNSVDE
ncbi:hypothetical protein [Peribacillus simplex]|uniref:hypothetical protein n=1 Tax=Peribacillus simplex TaxID=1478 RepID=UPI001628AD24|nr:hypothetical protein [Peribacillus simplex]